jgi:hypothetical protein
MMTVSEAAGLEAAALSARLEALSRENDRLWALVREERTSRDREIETLNRLVEQQNRLLDNASRLLDLATHQARGEIDLLRQQFETATRLRQTGGGGETAGGHNGTASGGLR